MKMFLKINETSKGEENKNQLVHTSGEKYSDSE